MSNPLSLASVMSTSSSVPPQGRGETNKGDQKPVIKFDPVGLDYIRALFNPPKSNSNPSTAALGRGSLGTVERTIRNVGKITGWTGVRNSLPEIPDFDNFFRTSSEIDRRGQLDKYSRNGFENRHYDTSKIVKKSKLVHE